MKLELKTVFGDVIFEGDFSCISDLVTAALAAKKSLSYADLRSANLSSANLRSANLSSANLRSAYLRSANLRYANLRYANLSSADLSSANLSYADLSSANLRSANLRSANLRSANLRSADLSSIKHDFWAVLTCAKNEVGGLRLALVEGRINGSSYTGECACLVGTIANTKHCSIEALPSLKADADRPAERFFLGIGVGDTPDKSAHAKIALEWLDEWAALMEIKL